MPAGTASASPPGPAPARVLPVCARRHARPLPRWCDHDHRAGWPAHWQVSAGCATTGIMNRTGPPDVAGVQPFDRRPIMAERIRPRLRTQRAVAGALLPVATAVLLVIALNRPVHRGGGSLTAVTAAVIACWALAAVVCAW